MLAVTLAVFWPDTAPDDRLRGLPAARLGGPARHPARDAHPAVRRLRRRLRASPSPATGRSPGTLRGVPDDLTPALLYLFIAAACYLVVPLSLTVERLVRVTGQATRSATTIERLLDSATGTVFIATDAIGRITHYNAGAEQLLGYTPEEVVGLNPGMFHTDEEIARQATHFGVPPDHIRVVLAMVEAGERRDWEFRTRTAAADDLADPERGHRARRHRARLHRHRRGHHRAAAGPGGAADGRSTASTPRCCGSRRSTTSSRSSSPTSATSCARRSPASPATPSCSARATSASSTRGQVDAVERIERNTKRLGLLVEDLLTLSRAESGELELARERGRPAQRGARGLRAAARSWCALRALDLRFELPDEPVVILGDAPALERVVMNLISNAIKFTPDSGRVTVAREPDRRRGRARSSPTPGSASPRRTRSTCSPGSSGPRPRPSRPSRAPAWG